MSFETFSINSVRRLASVQLSSDVRHFPQARLIDDLRIALRPVLLGAGENLFAGLDIRLTVTSASEP
jgi:dihydrofolate reductase